MDHPERATRWRPHSTKAMIAGRALEGETEGRYSSSPDSQSSTDDDVFEDAMEDVVSRSNSWVSERFSFRGTSHGEPPQLILEPVQMISRTPVEVPPPDDIEEQCDSCGLNYQISLCNVCMLLLCNACWDGQTSHKVGRLGPNGLPHEKTSPATAETVEKALKPPLDDVSRDNLYRDDEFTAWFGVDRPSDHSPPVFQDFGRFSDLMDSTNSVHATSTPTFSVTGAQLGRDTRTPSLVSFVGQTGAGKSTLIKLLVDFAEEKKQSNMRFPTPVVGSPGAHVPTSSDVHLYIDPRTAGTDQPLLLADCEGLQGGEREPLSSRFKRLIRERSTTPTASKAISERELKWANDSSTRKREFAVTNLYPRLLYSFSDVIVFVLKESRTVEKVFERLLEWAAAAIEKSSNQPTLPHAMVVLNASDHAIPSEQWDVKYNTDSILDGLSPTVNRNEKFKELAQQWRERGQTIDSLEQLALCYYNSIQIIRIPADGRPQLMKRQVDDLYSAISCACFASRAEKNRLRMLLDVDELQAYLQDAFNHYSETLETPFDFVQASFRHSPIPADFGGNILKLALIVMETWEKRQASGAEIFSSFSYLVASCIMVDSVRNKSKGSAEQLFPEYLSFLDDALKNFCEQHWPCEFTSTKSGMRCINVQSGHSTKGHQSQDGKIFATGSYHSHFTYVNYRGEFRNRVFRRLQELLKELSKRRGVLRQDESAAAAAMHRDLLRKFVLEVFGEESRVDTNEDQWKSHTACLCCLMEYPVHVLRCGHVLCTSCVKMFGKVLGETEIELHECPLQVDVGMDHKFEHSTIFLKPESAGVRILTLDGGGIRGIAELVVLREIEKTLKGHLPLQGFFDLIVGTSTGGLVALGIGVMGWTASRCIEQFEELCNIAFTKRWGIDVPGLDILVESYHHSKYQTTPLETALKTAFTESKYLFSGSQSSNAVTPLKVAVTATSQAGKRTFVLANYNRPASTRHSKRASHELKIWEAARATAAAPRYFRAFHHEKSQKSYIDGAVYHNNPINIAESERKILWPSSEMPDLILSLGTTFNQKLHRMESERANGGKRGWIPYSRNILALAKNHMATSLDCEKAWTDFKSHLPAEQKDSLRFTRINPELAGDVPDLDSTKDIPALKKEVLDVIRNTRIIQEVTLQLISSSFYFQLIGPISERPAGGFDVEGRIRCRFPKESSQIRGLGDFLIREAMKCGNENFYFMVKEVGQDIKNVVRLKIDSDVLSRMTGSGIFEMRPLRFNLGSQMYRTDISLHFGGGDELRISGFPRSLWSDLTTGPRRVSNQSLVEGSPRYSHGSRRRRKNPVRWQPPVSQSFSHEESYEYYLRYGDPMTRRAYSSDDEEDDTISSVISPDPWSLRVRGAFKALLWPLKLRMSREYIIPELDSREVPHEKPSSFESFRSLTAFELNRAAQKEIHELEGGYNHWQDWVTRLERSGPVELPWDPPRGHDQDLPVIYRPPVPPTGYIPYRPPT